MRFIQILHDYVMPFLIVLTPLVFVHEFGHYLVARFYKVKIETFSIGFGPELIGFTDKSGTRWKLSILPLGGYVQMFGDSDASSSRADSAKLSQLSEDERKTIFWNKPVGQRAAVTVAGPLVNYIFAILVLAVLFMTYGQPYSPAEVGQVQDGSAAAAAGIKVGDIIRSCDGSEVDRFEDLQRIIGLNRSTAIPLTVDRHGSLLHLTATPKMTEATDAFGFKHKTARLGIVRSGVVFRKLTLIRSVPAAVGETVNITTSTLRALWQIVTGTRNSDELGGPIRIAQMSGEMHKDGAAAMIYFLAILSINLGLINLFPIPLLDGGHLAFYACEAVRGRPLSERAQEIGACVGLTMVLSLMVFATWNDLVQLNVVSYIKNLLL